MTDRETINGRVKTTIEKHNLLADQTVKGAIREALTILRRESSQRYLSAQCEENKARALADCDELSALIQAADHTTHPTTAPPCTTT